MHVQANGGLINVMLYNHDLIDTKVPKDFLNHNDIVFCRKCTKCDLVIIECKFDNEYYVGTDHWFYYNNEEIFDYFENLTQLNLICEEFIIKNVIE